MIEPYALPHECERESLAQKLATLRPRQRQVLRSYVWQVELGELTVSAWLAAESCPISRSMWYDGGPKARYWGNGAFRTAVEAYTQAGLEWQTNQERRAVEAAQRRIRRAAPAAAERLVDQVGADIGEFFRVAERWTAAPLPTQEIVDERDLETTNKRTGETEIEHQYLVRTVVMDVAKLKDPRYGRWVREFSDSPKNGLGLKLHDPVRAAESLLDRADVETASKAEAKSETTVNLDEETINRLDQVLMAAIYGPAGGAQPSDEGGLGE